MSMLYKWSLLATTVQGSHAEAGELDSSMDVGVTPAVLVNGRTQ